MGALEQLLKIGDMAAGVDTSDVVWQVLTQLAPEWVPLARKLTDLGLDARMDEPADLLDLIQDEAHVETVKAALTALGLVDVARLLDEARDSIAALPADFRLLLNRYDSFQESADSGAGSVGDPRVGNDKGLVKLPLVTVDEGASGTSGKLDFALTVEAGAALEAEAGALWPYSDGIDRPALLRLAARAHIAASGKASLPFKFGTVSASGSAAADALCEWYVRPDATDRPFAQVLVATLPHLPNPFDLDSVWKAVTLNGFEGLVLSFDGETEAGVSVAVSRGADLPGILAAKVHVGVDVAVRRAATYNLSILADGPPGDTARTLTATLSHDRSAMDRWAAGVGLTVDAAPLIAKLHKQLVDATGTWGEALDTIKPFLNPGRYIQEQLDKELAGLVEGVIGNPAIADAITADLKLAIGSGDGDGSAIEQLLSRKLTDAIGTVRETLTGKTDTLAAKAVEELIRQLPAFAQAQARSIIEPGIAGLIGKLQSRLDGLVGELFAKKPKLLAKELKAVGITIDGLADRADTALAGVRTLIDRFDGLLHDLVDATAIAAKTKISAEFSIEVKREHRTSIDMVGTFSANTPATRDLYRAMVMGRMRPVQRLFNPAHAVPGFTLDPARSAISRYAATTSSIGYVLVLFGLEMSLKEIIKGEAEVTPFPNGDVAVVASGKFMRQGRQGDEFRSYGFVSSYQLMIAGDRARSGDDRRSIDLVVGLDHRDRKLKREEVAAFIGGLSTAGMIGPERTAAALTLFDSWVALHDGNRNTIGGDMTVRLTIDGAGVARLLDHGRAVREGGEAALALFRTAIDVQIAAGLWKSFDRHFDEFRRAVFRNSPPHAVDDPVAFLFKHRRFDAPGQVEAAEFVARANALLDLAGWMHDIFSAIPFSPRQPRGQWDEDGYRSAERELARQGRKWVNLNSAFFNFSPGIGARTIAFLTALCCIARTIDTAQALAASRGAASGDMFAITLTQTGDGAAPAAAI